MSEFTTLRELLAKASPYRSGDVLAGVAAESGEERVRAQMALADVPLKRFLNEAVVPYEDDEVTRLIMDSHDSQAFAPISSFTVGQFRDWLLSDAADTAALTAIAPGVTPEMAAAVSKIMRLQDLVSVASKCRVVVRFRDTLGLKGRFATRLQPNHPTDDAKGILAATIDGLYYGSGDAVIGINPATDSLPNITRLLCMLDGLISRYHIPTQSCVLTHVTNTIELINRGVPVDLTFQSLAGTEKANASFGISLSILDEAWDATKSLRRGTVGDNCMYFETGQGTGLSANANFGCDEQTIEARTYAVARRYRPLIVNTVVGFMGPEYLANGKQIIRAGLEDHFCAKLMGVPMGCDVCYTNHIDADQDDMDVLLTMLAAAGCNYVIGIPGADDVMLNYQSTSFHDAVYVRRLLGLRPAPEFESWLESMGVHDRDGNLLPAGGSFRALEEGISGTGTHSCRSMEEEDGAGDAQVRLSCSRAGASPSRAGERPNVTGDPWTELKSFTDARIALGRCGAGVPHEAWLDFSLDHAKARDAVRKPLDRASVRVPLENAGYEVIDVESACGSLETYLQRPDLGRRLSESSRALLSGLDSSQKGKDVCVCICDGLSSTAVQENAASVAISFIGEARKAGLSVAPVVLAEHGRVALGDDVCVALGARSVVVLIGERPGLSSPDSLGVYMTYAPFRGCTDEARNCISNVRPAGLSVKEAVLKLCYLLQGAFVRKLSGVSLKDDMPAGYLPFAPQYSSLSGAR